MAGHAFGQVEGAVVPYLSLIHISAMLDPHTAAELSLDDIRSMCDDLFAVSYTHLDVYKRQGAP